MGRIFFKKKKSETDTVPFWKLGSFLPKCLKAVISLSFLIVLSITQNVKANDSFEEPEVFFAELEVSGYKLSNDIYIVIANDIVYIEWLALVDALEFQIDESPDGYSGWTFNSKYPLIWDTTTNLLLYAETEIPLTAKDTYDDEGTLLVSLPFLNQWFELNAEFDKGAQALSADPEVNLLFEEKLERESNFIKTRYKDKSKKEFEFYPDNYSLITDPSFRFRISTDYSKSEEASSVKIGGSVSGDMDVLYHSTKFSFSLQPGAGIEDPSISFQRKLLSFDSDDKIREHTYKFGDTNISSNRFVGGQSSGTGINYFTGREGVTRNEDKTDIRGEAPLGWDVELYDDINLISIVKVENEEEYLFEDVTLKNGKNVFTIKKYGPRGEFESETKVFWGGGIDLDPGEFQFEAGLLLSDEDFIPFLENGFESEPQAAFRGFYGYSNNFSLGFGAYNIALAPEGSNTTEQQTYLDFSFRYKLATTVLEFENVLDPEGELASDFAASGSVFGK